MKILFLLLFLRSSLLLSQSNLDFEKKLFHWIPSGTAFNNQPELGNTVRTYRVRPEISNSIGGDYWRGLPHSIGHQGNYWVTSYKINSEDSIYSNDSISNFPTGSLRSDVFRISSDKIFFLLGGNGGRVELWIEKDGNFQESPDILINDSIFFQNYVLVNWKIPLNGIEVMSREYFLTQNETKSYIDKNAILRIVDSSETEHINVDDFYFNENDSDEIVNYKFRTSYFNDSNNFTEIKYFKNRDKNLPLWGFTDTHGHWMNNEAFGVDLVFGKPFGNIDTSLKNCKSIHGIFGKNILFYPSLHNESELTGYPDFKGWPNFRDQVHQTMFVEWVRRAYLGGLRLIVCPMGNNTNLAKVMGSELNEIEYSDTATVRREVKYLDNMISILRKEGWIDIANSSNDAIKLLLENKLVIIKGMEVDQPGGFLYFDKNQSEQKNKDSLEKFVNYIYDDLGIRHMFPIHHCDNAFGGFSLYGTEFFSINNYQLKKSLGKKISEKDMYVEVDSSSIISFRLGTETDIKYKSFKLGNIPLEGFYRPPGSNPLIFTGYSNYSTAYKKKGHINKKGLTPSGKDLIKIMAAKGMIIDIDHMSMKATDDVLDILENDFKDENDSKLYYPVLAGHSNFLEQQLTLDETSDCENCLLKLKNEHAKTKEMLNRISKLGGMVSPITEGDKDVRSEFFHKKESPGSSKSWAESYIFAYNNFGKGNIGLGTDMNGLVTQISPRFGTYSSYSLRDDDIRMENLGSRRYLSYIQKNGVKYTSNLKDCKIEKFKGKNVFTKKQPEIWQTIYAAHSDYLTNLNTEQEAMKEGFRLGIDSIIIENINLKILNLNELKLAAYIVAFKYEHQIDLPKNKFCYGLNPRKVQQWIEKIDPIYWNYSNTIGKNIPLKRCEIPTKNNGVKDFDFNIDGLAHYGLFPDFMQDLKNIGLSYDQLSVLFSSAGDFAKMLERCEYVSNKLKLKK